MSVYLIAAVTRNNNDEDRRTYDLYAAGGGASIEKFGVETLAVDEHPQIIEGQLPGEKVVLFKFRDQAHLDAWYRSEDYQSILPLRWKSAKVAFVMSFQSLD